MTIDLVERDWPLFDLIYRMPDGVLYVARVSAPSEAVVHQGPVGVVIQGHGAAILQVRRAFYAELDYSPWPDIDPGMCNEEIDALAKILPKALDCFDCGEFTLVLPDVPGPPTCSRHLGFYECYKCGDALDAWGQCPRSMASFESAFAAEAAPVAEVSPMGDNDDDEPGLL